MSHYVATVTREDGYWVAVVDGLRGGATEARTLANLEDEVRDLIAGLTDVDEDQVDVELQFAVKHASVMAAVEQIKAARQLLDQAKAAYEESQREAVRTLHDEEISTRDAAKLVGLSHQRVSQLLNATGRDPHIGESTSHGKDPSIGESQATGRRVAKSKAMSALDGRYDGVSKAAARAAGPSVAASASAGSRKIKPS